jgi:predicted nuclease of predicted toxin-antitoxin system
MQIYHGEMTIILKQYFEECIHVDKSGLRVPAKDIDIWNYAKKNDYIIVTKDEDFVDFLNVKGFPPKLILLKTGNQSRLYLCNLLIQRKDDIEAFIKNSEYGLLQILSPI